MKPPKCRNWSGRIRSLTPPAVLSSIFIAWCQFIAAPVRAGGTVADCAEASLRAAMAGGGTVTFACDGTITLANTISNSVNTVLDGSGRQITISGGDAVRVFVVETNVSLTLSQLTIANGLSDNGAGVLNAGGHLILQHCVLINNVATGGDAPLYTGFAGSNGCGGAVWNIGTLTANSCTFVSNSAVGGSGGASPTSGPPGAGGQGIGGAAVNFGTMGLTNCSLVGNRASGGNGGDELSEWPGAAGGAGNGGAIGNFGALCMTRCLLASNTCAGGSGGTGGNGFYTINPENNGSAGGCGGNGAGGAVFNNGTAFLVNNTLTANLAQGGSGGNGGNGQAPMTSGDWAGNGGNGGSGGSSCSAIEDADGLCVVINCTMALNQATPAAGGTGGFAGQWIYPFPYPPHRGEPGTDGVSGQAGPALDASGAALCNSILSSNSPANGSSAISDQGHNLSSDATCGFTAPGSLNNTAPRLGPLADNGGPTPTMALLPGSPAIDAADATGAPATDQRGVARPQGPRADIGACEFQYPQFAPITFENTNCRLQMLGLEPNQTFAVQASSNLVNSDHH